MTQYYFLPPSQHGTILKNYYEAQQRCDILSTVAHDCLESEISEDFKENMATLGFEADLKNCDFRQTVVFPEPTLTCAEEKFERPLEKVRFPFELSEKTV